MNNSLGFEGILKPYKVPITKLNLAKLGFIRTLLPKRFNKNRLQEMLARELMYCTFNPLVGDNMERCSANQSVAFYWSFIGNNQESIFCESPFRPKIFSNQFFPSCFGHISIRKKNKYKFIWLLWTWIV
jgi:hypothetical protein